MKMNPIDWIAMILVIIGGLNWGIVGAAKYDLVAAIVGKTFGEVNMISQIIYILVGVAALWMLVRLLMGGSKKAVAPTGTPTM
jgi:hypothetical protein